MLSRTPCLNDSPAPSGCNCKSRIKARSACSCLSTAFLGGFHASFSFHRICPVGLLPFPRWLRSSLPCVALSTIPSTAPSPARRSRFNPRIQPLPCTRQPARTGRLRNHQGAHRRLSAQGRSTRIRQRLADPHTRLGDQPHFTYPDARRPGGGVRSGHHRERQLPPPIQSLPQPSSPSRKSPRPQAPAAPSAWK